MFAVGQFSVPEDHACLPGHFPGRPVVPGVVLLDEALAIMLARFPGRALAGIASVKFTGAVLPGQIVEVACAAAPPDRLDFVCTVGGSAVLRGRARLGG